MKFLSNSRQFHKALAPWVFLPLFISSITGLFYRVSKDLLGYSRDQVHWLMSLHEGEWPKCFQKQFHLPKRLLKASQKVKI